jgi:hypothetical protein
MKKLLLITIILLLQSFPSFGEWKKVTQSKDKLYTSYLDFDNVVKKDGHILIWNLTDFSKKDEYGHLSHIEYLKVDCKLRKTKTMVIHIYECQMGNCGPKLTNDVEDIKWYYPIPQTFGYRTLKSICEN